LNMGTDRTRCNDFAIVPVEKGHGICESP
jgi:hypothetical protein